MLRFGALVGLGLAGCNGTTFHEDLGRACLGVPVPFATTEGTLTIDADGAAPVTVVFSECTSGSISWIDPTCEVTVEGDRIVVHTTVSTDSPNSQTSDCRWVDHDCGTVDLPAGSYTLVYGEGEQAFDVPYEGAPICAAND